jgi:RNA-directed DNA polymerase
LKLRAIQSQEKESVVIVKTPLVPDPADPRNWDLLSVALELGFTDVFALSAALGSADRGYALFVPRGDEGRRVISAPHKWLKALQRRALHSFIDQLPISESVYSCRGRGVIKNAEQHLDSKYMTVMDVAACFPSTRQHAICTSFVDAGVPLEVAGALTRLTTRHGFLPQGPPTSPAVLSIVFRPIDKALHEVAESYGALYTRYMDDLAFSGDHSLDGLAREAARILRRFGYRSNPDKRRVWGPDDQHTITKIVVNTSLNATQEFLDALTMHLAQLKKGECNLTTSQLRGKLNYVTDLKRLHGRELDSERRRNAVRARRSARAV